MVDVLDRLAALVAAHPALRLDLLGELFLAALLGGAIGWERGTHGKPAGLRTNILICVGAALLTDLSAKLASPYGDPTRVSAQIVSGIGFLGAGTIIQSRGSVIGLTTAATLWVVAAIGMAVGGGHYVEAVGTTLCVFVVLAPLGHWENRSEARRSAEEAATTEAAVGARGAEET